MRNNLKTLKKLIFYKKFMEEIKMEETKHVEKTEAHEGHHGHRGHHCHGMMCKCGPMGHKFIKLVLAIFLVILLLSIGAAMGSRHSYRNYGYGSYDRFDRGGCPMMRGDWRDAGIQQNGRQFNMMRGQAGQAGFQIIESGAPIYTPVNSVPATPAGTSSPSAPLR